MAIPRYSSHIEVYALASGSSGNATLVKADGIAVLIDAGVGVRKLSSLLHGKGVLAADLDAVLVTHEHIDHIGGLGAVSRRTGAMVVGNSATLAACADRDQLLENTHELAPGDTLGVGCIGIRSFPVSHDAVDPVGYVLEIGNWKMVYFTDAGEVTADIKQAVAGAQLVVAEANHDIEWLRRGPYTADMKRRVASTTGHLSNDDCADLLAETIECHGELTVWLAHLSRVNNSPSLARRSVTERIKRQTKRQFELDVALRDSPSASYVSGARAYQLSLF